MKKIIILISLILSLSLFTACNKDKELEKYSDQFFDTFDTVVDVSVYTENEKEGQRQLELIKNEFERLNKLFDRYNKYEGISNFCNVNENAGIAPVKVSPEAYKLIKDTFTYNKELSNKVDISIGPVVDLWTKYRDLYNEGKTKEEVKALTGSYLPTEEALKALRPLLGMDKIVLNDEESSIYLKEKGMKIDIGAVAKGYATELAAQKAIKEGVKHCVISAGGNVRIIGDFPKNDSGKTAFAIGVRNPDVDENTNGMDSISEVLHLNDTSAVTSGDYQRYFDLDGIRYCHIIDPLTLKPAHDFKSVTIIAKDSGLCDFLSTTCFLLPIEEGEKLLKEKNALGIWIDKDSNTYMMEGAQELTDRGQK